MKETVIELLEKRLRETPDRIYLKHREAGQGWRGMTWSEYGLRIEQVSRALMALGVHPGDKVALIGNTSPDWFVVDMSIMTLGCVTAPIYFSSSTEQIAYILNHSDSRFLIVLNPEYMPRVQSALSECNGIEKVITPDEIDIADNPCFIKRSEFERAGNTLPHKQLQKARKDVASEDVATFIYTSGTTGPPKACMIMQKNCYHSATSVGASLGFLHAQVDPITVCCFMTPAHVFERSNAMLSPIVSGAVVYFGDISKALEEIQEIKPVVVMGLPRTWEKIYETIMSHRGTLSADEQKFFDWALDIGMQYNKAIYEKRSIPSELQDQYRSAKELVINKILAPLGFDNAKHFMTGGAVSSKEVIDFFFAIGVWICQVYGQTEALGVGSIGTREMRRFGSVGIPFPGVEAKIAEDGEILLRGGVISAGYYKEPELTGETIRDGWLYTGDLGQIDADGYLYIIGRKKDIIITSGAKNITPAKIEAALMGCPLVEYAVVVGEGRKYLTALLTLSLDGGIAFAKRIGLAANTYEDLLARKELRAEIEKYVQKINEKYSRVEQIKKFAILSEPLSIENGELTMINKIKRYVIIEKHVAEIDKMYS